MLRSERAGVYLKWKMPKVNYAITAITLSVSWYQKFWKEGEGPASHLPLEELLTYIRSFFENHQRNLRYPHFVDNILSLRLGLLIIFLLSRSFLTCPCVKPHYYFLKRTAKRLRHISPLFLWIFICNNKSENKKKLNVFH